MLPGAMRNGPVPEVGCGWRSIVPSRLAHAQRIQGGRHRSLSQVSDGTDRGECPTLTIEARNQPSFPPAVTAPPNRAAELRHLFVSTSHSRKRKPMHEISIDATRFAAVIVCTCGWRDIARTRATAWGIAAMHLRICHGDLVGARRALQAARDAHYRDQLRFKAKGKRVPGPGPRRRGDRTTRPPNPSREMTGRPGQRSMPCHGWMPQPRRFRHSDPRGLPA